MNHTQLTEFLQDNITQITKTHFIDTMNRRSTWALAQITLAYCLKLITLQEYGKFVDDVIQAKVEFKART